ncbi:hypothetical protein NIES2109_22400 [Nostoc sp. HK-01]|uniref:CopG family transcriptional regulator n=1 Tax=Nostoc spongiaeforme FACHB-130 TaxID=1357510 RepID=A0ABR8FZ81_9NOSO|nr:hypothetical protein [Nostoc spongiaeforme]MBD2596420.1 hypothetical protein [Nostoc spongiaeforme FACHB-130]OCQ89500.1 hypothetical protein BCD64_26505 [Nostoc sp. MBR 210]BBD59455.1 hypothetical protein NIES2109_22400 [Nostoc sp. HK-01]
MQKLEIELDQETFAKINQLAQTYNCEISDIIKAMIDQLTQPEILNNSFIGKWGDEAELVDEMVADILKHRNYRD